MSLYTEVKRQVLESISLFLPNPETSGDPASLKWSCHGTILLPVAIGRAVKAALRSKVTPPTLSRYTCVMVLFHIRPRACQKPLRC